MNHSYTATTADGLEQVVVGSNGKFEHVRLDHPIPLGRGNQEIGVQDTGQNISTTSSDVKYLLILIA